MSGQYHPVMRYIASVVLSFLLSLFLLLLITALIISQTVFSSSYMTDRVDKSGFSEQAFLEMQEIYISHAMASGIPEGIMLSGLTPEHINNAIKSEIRAAYMTGRAYDFNQYEDELYEILRAFIADTAAVDSSAIDAGLRDLAELCAGDLKAHVVSPVIGMIGSAALQYNRYLSIAIAVLAVIVLLVAAVFPMINRRVSRWSSTYIWAIGAAVLACCIIPAFVYFSGFTKRLGITPQSYNNLLSSWIEGIAERYLAALLPLIPILILLVIIWVLRRKRRRSSG